MDGKGNKDKESGGSSMVSHEDAVLMMGLSPGAVVYSNPPTVIKADPNIDLSHLPASKHPPTLGPVRPQLKLEVSPTNPRKKEPRPFTLHFPNTLGDLDEKGFQFQMKQILLQFWVNEKVRDRERGREGGEGRGGACGEDAPTRDQQFTAATPVFRTNAALRTIVWPRAIAQSHRTLCAESRG